MSGQKDLIAFNYSSVYNNNFALTCTFGLVKLKCEAAVMHNSAYIHQVDNEHKLFFIFGYKDEEIHGLYFFFLHSLIMTAAEQLFSLAGVRLTHYEDSHSIFPHKAN